VVTVSRMIPLLGAGLPEGVEVIDIEDVASVSLVRVAVRKLGAALGMSPVRFEALVNAASELGHNQLAHGYRGVVTVSAISRDGVPGIEVVAIDGGKGIGDPTTALGGQSRAAGSLGVGLSAAYRLSDEMDFDVRLSEGTYVAARKFAAPLPRSEVAVFGRPIEGERVSGDDAAFTRTGEVLLVGVFDGLGHGAEARAASVRGAQALRAHGGGEVTALVSACDVALQGTRGAVMAAARLDRPARELTHASAGNISTHLYRPRFTRRFLASSWVLGARGGPARRINVERESLEPRPLLVMFSDGISSRADLSEDLELLRQPPLVIAHQVLARFGRTTDDALVLVAS
jgi:anti-sigma regulatory factor (Ser/Thr protein kinase)